MEQRTINRIMRRARIRNVTKKILLTLVIYAIAIFYFFPILYMFLSGFKTEQQAILPKIIFTPTLVTFKKVLSDPTMYRYLRNSLFQVVVGTTLSLLLGVPASFVLVFGNLKKPEFILRLPMITAAYS